jgi:hypothetical protein
MGLSGSQVASTYLCSLSAVRYMIESFGMYRVKGMLDELAKGANTDNAIGRSIMLSYEEFQRGWKRSLE